MVRRLDGRNGSDRNQRGHDKAAALLGTRRLYLGRSRLRRRMNEYAAIKQAKPGPGQINQATGPGWRPYLQADRKDLLRRRREITSRKPYPPANPKPIPRLKISNATSMTWPKHFSCLVVPPSRHTDLKPRQPVRANTDNTPHPVLPPFTILPSEPGPGPCRSRDAGRAAPGRTSTEIK
jgi:hypothetical protein